MRLDQAVLPGFIAHEPVVPVLGRGLSGVRLVTSDSHLGLKQAVAEVLGAAT